MEDEEKLQKFLDENIHVLDSSRHKDIHHLKRKLDARRVKRAKGSKVHSLDKGDVDKMRVFDVVRVERTAAASQAAPSPPKEPCSAKATPEKRQILDRYQLVLSGQAQDDFAGCPFRKGFVFGRLVRESHA